MWPKLPGRAFASDGSAFYIAAVTRITNFGWQRLLRLLAIFLVSSLSAAPGLAQLQLPGGIGQPAPAGTVVAPPVEAPREKPKPPILRTPSEDAIVGRTLLRNGSTGSLVIERAGKNLRVQKLALTGDQISKPNEHCRVEVSGTPLVLTSEGKPAGLSRYKLALDICPFSFDVLDGAVLASNGGKTCEFKAADCQVDPAGLWGPRPSEFGPERTKEFERERAHAESTMRADFRALLAGTKDKQEIKALASEQAGFSSQREEKCRTYTGEDVHGFCALRFTEARAIALGTRLTGVEEAKPKQPRKPKPVAPPEAAVQEPVRQ
ncbi:MAG: hypothetical protein QOF41_522 [Methylobacteriaceae bacterium]|nr:hypothetical protein [Methylobacteriaceae bacterium]